MDKYKRLASNTLLFTISQFSGRLLSFFFNKFYTATLGDNLGVAEQILVNINVLQPIVTFAIVDAVTRYALDNKYKKDVVFSSGLVIMLTGFIGFIAAFPLVTFSKVFQGMELLMYTYMLTSILRLLCAQFTRATLNTTLYAVDAVLAIVTTIGFNVLFLGVFNLGLPGYFLATIASDFCSILFLSLIMKIWRFVNFTKVKWKSVKILLRYSLPLIPSNSAWWLLSAIPLDFLRVNTTSFHQTLYTNAGKVSSIISTFVNIFSSAWQISTVTDGQDKEQSQFFSNVFKMLSTLSILAASSIILFSQIIIKFISVDKYYDAWSLMPLLVLAAVFSCFASFHNSVFLLKKKTFLSFVTIALSILVAWIANYFFVPLLGVIGAPLSTCIAAFFYYISRLILSRKYIKINIKMPHFIFSIALLIIQVITATLNIAFWKLLSVGILLILVFLNFDSIRSILDFAFNKILKPLLKKQKPQ